MLSLDDTGNSSVNSRPTPKAAIIINITSGLLFTPFSLALSISDSPWDRLLRGDSLSLSAACRVHHRHNVAAAFVIISQEKV
jgi:hypothetical protein